MRVIAIIENYDQYKGLEESVCMKKELMKATGLSEFKNLPVLNISYLKKILLKRIFVASR